MTLGEAIRLVRRYLDESTWEYFSNDDIIVALDIAEKQRLSELVREHNYTAIDSLWIDSGIVQCVATPRGDWRYDVTLLPRIVYMGTFLCSMYPSMTSLDLRRAVYRKPSIYLTYLHRNPNSGSVWGKLMYTVIGTTIFHNGAIDPSSGVAQCRFMYIPEPSVVVQNNFSLPYDQHLFIVQQAARYLIAKTPPHIEHSGVIADNNFFQVESNNKQAEQT